MFRASALLNMTSSVIGARLFTVQRRIGVPPAAAATLDNDVVRAATAADVPVVVPTASSIDWPFG